MVEQSYHLVEHGCGDAVVAGRDIGKLLRCSVAFGLLDVPWSIGLRDECLD